MFQFSKKTFRMVCGVSALVLLALGVLFLLTKSFIVEVIAHTFIRLIGLCVSIMILQKVFEKQLPCSMKKVLFWCGLVLFADLIVVHAVRYILASGISSVLFLPISMPLCFMIIMLYSCKDMGGDNKEEKRLTYITGIPLLVLSLYFEVLAFIQV